MRFVFIVILLLMPMHAYAHGSTLAALVSLVFSNIAMYLALMVASLLFAPKGERLAGFLLVAVCYPVAFFFVVPLVANSFFTGHNADRAWEIGMYAVFALLLLGLFYSRFTDSEQGKTGTDLFFE